MTGIDWADAWPGDGDVLGEIFCLTFIKGVDDREALRRMGGLPDTFATRSHSDVGELHNFDDGYPMVALALPLGTWTIVFEPNGFEGAHLLPALSRGTEAVSVLRHDYASPTFGYAVAGDLITQFDPNFPNHRHGTTPDLLLPRMLEVGFTEEEEDGQYDHAIGRCLRLAEHITGLLPTYDALNAPLTSAQIEPWFSDMPKPPARRPGLDQPVNAIAEVRRLTALHGLTDTPGLADALATAERGHPVKVTPDSPLGHHIRTWLTESRRTNLSLNNHSAQHQTPTPTHHRTHDLGQLTRALGTALQANRQRDVTT